MRSSVFGKWVISRPLKSHVIMPAFFSLTLIAMYFSTMPFLQDLVAPGSGRPTTVSVAGRGALEGLQIFILLSIFFFTLRSVLASREWPVRLWVLLLMLGTAAVFLEEVDFGTSLVSLLSGQGLAPGQQELGGAAGTGGPLAGETVAGYVKLTGSLLVALYFVLAPLLMQGTRNRTLRLIAPSTWVLATVALTAVMDRVVSGLQDASLDTIGGMRGPLLYDLGEFRELLIYYLVLVYVAALHERLVIRWRQQE